MRYFVVTFLFLTACVQTQTPIVPKPERPKIACGADRHQNLIGQSADVLAAMTFLAPMRVIKHGMSVTMDYSEQRLNITIGKNNKISDVFCG